MSASRKKASKARALSVKPQQAATTQPAGASEPPRSGLRLGQPPSTPAFAELYEKFFPLVWRTARRMGVPDGSLDDVCQEVFIAIHRKLPEFTGQSTVRTWVFGFIFNIVQVHHRSQRRKSAYHRSTGDLVDPDTLTDQRPSADERMRSAEAAGMAHRALDRLSDDKRAVFVMSELEGLSATEIASALGLNVHTVYTRLRTARKEFQRLVRQQAVGKA
ncbi:MAG TPA: sigma-70 family RNA polymerase sigma factor [Polyangiaceae bacterium]|nr:sigma-70 family RNA polymerase sigma factor [Polyangiaceae bacterium]